MKTSLSILTLAVYAVLLSGLAGCTTSTGGDLLVEDIEPSMALQTKADVYRIFGVPDTIRAAGENTDHYYVFRRTRGGSVGAGVMLLRLTASRTHHAEDTLVFRIDPEGRVISINRMEGTAVLRGTFWPFGS